MSNAIQTIRPELLAFPWDALPALMPTLILLAAVVLGVVIAAGRTRLAAVASFAVALLALAGAGVTSFQRLGDTASVVFNGMATFDAFTQAFSCLAVVAAAVTILLSFRYLDREKIQFGEYYLLILFATLGMIWLVAALDLIVLFIALEIMSLSVYMLVGFRRSDRLSNEAAIKYFVLGGVASAIVLYGTAMLYGATGFLNIRDLLTFAQANSAALPPMFLLGTWMVIGGFLFKVAAVPFQAWMPDVYEGAPTPITGFMTTGLKAASFAALIRIFVSTGLGKGVGELIALHVRDILWVVAALTMLVGNVVALKQTNLKRMLAYSSIAHTGYLLIGLISGAHSDFGYGPMVLYLFAYTLMNLGAFSVLTLLSGTSDSRLQMSDLSGLSRRHPKLALALAIFMFSMAGIPPTAGFMGKYFLLYSAVQAGETALVIVAVLCSVISVFYYLRVLVFMYMREPGSEDSAGEVSRLSGLVIALLVAATMAVGIVPEYWVELAKTVVIPL